jgi:hypothetical protein
VRNRVCFDCATFVAAQCGGDALLRSLTTHACACLPLVTVSAHQQLPHVWWLQTSDNIFLARFALEVVYQQSFAPRDPIFQVSESRYSMCSISFVSLCSMSLLSWLGGTNGARTGDTNTTESMCSISFWWACNTGAGTRSYEHIMVSYTQRSRRRGQHCSQGRNCVHCRAANSRPCDFILTPAVSPCF